MPSRLVFSSRHSRQAAWPRVPFPNSRITIATRLRPSTLSRTRSSILESWSSDRKLLQPPLEVYDIWGFYAGHFANLAFEIPLFSSALTNNLIHILYRILCRSVFSEIFHDYLPRLTLRDVKDLQWGYLEQRRSRTCNFWLYSFNSPSVSHSLQIVQLLSQVIGP